MKNFQCNKPTASKAEARLLIRIIKLGTLPAAMYGYVHDVDLFRVEIVQDAVGDVQLFRSGHTVYLEITEGRFFFFFKTYIAERYGLSINHDAEVVIDIVGDVFVEGGLVFIE